MTNFFKTYRTVLAAAFVVTFAAFAIFGLTQPKEAAAQSCRTVDIGGASVSAAETVALGGEIIEDEETDTHTIDIDSYLNAGESADTLEFTLAVEGDASTVGGSMIAEAQGLSANVKVNGGLPDSDSQTFTRDVAGDSSAQFSLSATAWTGPGTPPPSGSYASAEAEVKGITLTICDSGGGGGNNPPNAVNDGSSTSRIPVQGDNQTSVDVLANDSDPDGDTLEIISASTNSGNTGVSIVSGGSELSYDPTGLSSSDFPFEDEISYTIEDPDGASDSATAYINIAGGDGSTGNVIIRAGNSTSVDILSTITVNPEYVDADKNAVLEGGKQLGEKTLGQAVLSGWNVPLHEEINYFEVYPGMFNIPDGYELTSLEADSLGPIIKTKAEPNGDQTGSNNRLAMGGGGTSGGGGGGGGGDGGGSTCDETNFIPSMSLWDPSQCSQTIDSSIASDDGGNCSVQAYEWSADTVNIVPHGAIVQSGSPQPQSFSISSTGVSGSIRLRLRDSQGDWGPYATQTISCNN